VLEDVERALGHVDGGPFVGDVEVADRDEHDVLDTGSSVGWKGQA
jgi:hypothetical protein